MVSTTPGPGVDANGRAATDPTDNVTALVDAAMLRQDDLRLASEKRLDDLRNSDRDRQTEVAQIRSQHAHELRAIETARLDAIRENDQGQVQRAADVAQTALNALASQGTEQAETLRAAVESRAVTQESRLLAALDPIQKDIADLRRVQYEAVGGKTQVQDTQAKSGNQGLWLGLAISAVVMLGGFVSILIAAAGFAYLVTR